VADRDELIDRYLEALELELQQLGVPRGMDTLFLGGGTPTHPPAAQLQRLLATVQRWLPPASGCEFSIEANPADLDDEKVPLLATAGVTRVSLGVQSFDKGILTTLERDHTPAQIAPAIDRLRRSGIGNLAVDLIFGVPGQSLSVWRQSLEAAISLNVPHISTYGLTFERGTAFWSRRQKGTLHPVPEELEREMYALAMDRLTGAGWEQYELSNFARPGSECRHNRTYWDGEAYFGFGPGAASYLGGTRRLNHRSVSTWLRQRLSGELVPASEETLPPLERARELAMLGLRQTAGIDLHLFAERTGFDLLDLVPDRCQRLIGDGLLQLTAGRLHLTRSGRFLADTVTCEFL
jgi:oxygen-independent coproporphyrinogen-3 oxidase